MFPVVSEVVNVAELCLLCAHDFSQHCRVLVLCRALPEHILFRVRLAVLGAANLEQVEMRVPPPHRHLEVPIQLSESRVAWHLQTAPDGWPDVPQSDLQLANPLLDRQWHRSHRAPSC